MKRGVLILTLLFILTAMSVTAATENTTTHVRILNTPPVVNVVLANPDPAEVGVDTMSVTANVTDVNGVPIDIQQVNVTFDAGTAGTGDDITVVMIYNATSGLFQNNTVPIPSGAELGNWTANVTAWDTALDSDSNFTLFIVQDTIPPVVVITEPTPNQTFPNGPNVTIEINITDNGTIDTAIATIECPPDPATNVTLTFNATSGLWQGDYEPISPNTVCNVTTYVNDTGGNINNSGPVTFNIGDTQLPVIQAVVDSPDPVDPGQTLIVNASITDNTNVSTVTLEVDYGNGTQENFTMVLISGDTSNGTWTNQSVNTFLPAGTYNYTVYANDTAGNEANPGNGTFTVNTLVNIELDQVPIEFGNTTIPVTQRRADNSTAGSGYPGGTVKGFPAVVNNTGNVEVNVTIAGTNLTGQSNPAYEIDVSQVEWNLTASPGIALTTTAATLKDNLAAFTTNTQDVYFWISIPIGYIPQDYNGTVTFTAVQA